MEEKKYELIASDTIDYNGHTLYRIRALKDFGNVKKGDLGGYIEKENNLSHEGNCWIFGRAKVFDNSRVSRDAKVYGNARIYGNAWIFGDAKVFGNALVCGKARIYGNAQVINAIVCDNARVYDNALVSDRAKVYGYADVYHDAMVSGDAEVFGDSKICGNAALSNDAHIKSNSDYLFIVDSKSLYITLFKCKDGHIHVNCEERCDCCKFFLFNESLEEFEKNRKTLSANKKMKKEYNAIINYAKIRFGLE